MAHVATIDPHNDAVVKPAMMRLDRKLYETLLKYKANRSTMDQLFEGLKSELGIYTSIAIIRGYELGCSHVNVPPDNIMKHMLDRRAKHRAAKAAREILRSTRNVLDIRAGLSKETVASRQRTKGIAEYELPRMMFMGGRKGWDSISGYRMPTMRWLTAGDNPCETCQENEDAGPIAVDDTFPSGDSEPPGHLHCLCLLGLYI